MRSIFLVLFLASIARAQSVHYQLKVTPDLEKRELHVAEAVEFERPAGLAEFEKQPALKIVDSRLDDGEIEVERNRVVLKLRRSGQHKLTLSLIATPGRGILWFPNQPGFDTAFYCDAWMVCDTNPANRATLNMEIVLATRSGLTAVAPGQLERQWEDSQGMHFSFEQSVPVQTYLFSFGVAKVNRLESGAFVLYAPDSDGHERAFARTAKVYAFLREKAGTGVGDGRYMQAVMANGIAQEAAALALMPNDFLTELEERGDDRLMTHELAHQWWGVLVGIRSWSDFWLNEGMADFMQDAFLQQEKGKAAYDEEIAKAKQELKDLQATGSDRPLHWDGWQDAHGALGRIPYVKGSLFLDRLRSELGETAFWRGLALYTTRNSGRLVDSRDFENAMEEASGRNLETLFDQTVFH